MLDSSVLKDEADIYFYADGYEEDNGWPSFRAIIYVTDNILNVRVEKGSGGKDRGFILAEIVASDLNEARIVAFSRSLEGFALLTEIAVAGNNLHMSMYICPSAISHVIVLPQLEPGEEGWKELQSLYQ